MINTRIVVERTIESSTSKAAADAMAYQLGVPSIEGLIRNRYSGRTFIEGSDDREAKAAAKYCELPLFKYLGGSNANLLPAPQFP